MSLNGWHTSCVVEVLQLAQHITSKVLEAGSIVIPQGNFAAGVQTGRGVLRIGGVVREVAVRGSGGIASTKPQITHWVREVELATGSSNSLLGTSEALNLLNHNILGLALVQLALILLNQDVLTPDVGHGHRQTGRSDDVNNRGQVDALGILVLPVIRISSRNCSMVALNADHLLKGFNELELQSHGVVLQAAESQSLLRHGPGLLAEPQGVQVSLDGDRRQVGAEAHRLGHVTNHLHVTLVLACRQVGLSQGIQSHGIELDDRNVVGLEGTMLQRIVAKVSAVSNTIVDLLASLHLDVRSGESEVGVANEVSSLSELVVRGRNLTRSLQGHGNASEVGDGLNILVMQTRHLLAIIQALIKTREGRDIEPARGNVGSGLCRHVCFGWRENFLTLFCGEFEKVRTQKLRPKNENREKVGPPSQNKKKSNMSKEEAKEQAKREPRKARPPMALEQIGALADEVVRNASKIGDFFSANRKTLVLPEDHPSRSEWTTLCKDIHKLVTLYKKLLKCKKGKKKAVEGVMPKNRGFKQERWIIPAAVEFINKYGDFPPELQVVPVKGSGGHALFTIAQGTQLFGSYYPDTRGLKNAAKRSEVTMDEPLLKLFEPYMQDLKKSQTWKDADGKICITHPVLQHLIPRLFLEGLPVPEEFKTPAELERLEARHKLLKQRTSGAREKRDAEAKAAKTVAKAAKILEAARAIGATIPEAAK